MKSHKTLLFIGLILSLWCLAAHSRGLIACRDADGGVTFTDGKCPGAEIEVKSKHQTAVPVTQDAPTQDERAASDARIKKQAEDWSKSVDHYGHQ